MWNYLITSYCIATIWRYTNRIKPLVNSAVPQKNTANYADLVEAFGPLCLHFANWTAAKTYSVACIHFLLSISLYCYNVVLVFVCIILYNTALKQIEMFLHNWFQIFHFFMLSLFLIVSHRCNMASWRPIHTGDDDSVDHQSDNVRKSNHWKKGRKTITHCSNSRRQHM